MGKFDFGNANVNQKEAIVTTEGPVLIIAGPGTGKTFTLVKRAVYLIVEKGIKPENIMIATFTEKAAKEIITRISNELLTIGINVNINEMYIGTFHSICLRILKENLEFTRLKKNYRLLDQFEQQYMIYQNISRFRKISNYDLIFDKIISTWKQSGKLAHYIGVIQEELVDTGKLLKDEDKRIVAIAEVVNIYKEILNEENILDFSAIQVETLNLFRQNPTILNDFINKIQYIMVDEYQDTNYVQEQFIFMLANERKNLCVVGDDDQGLYRFRGATIRNILEFPSKFEDKVCKEIKLTINYRSDKGIIDFYNSWMKETTGNSFKFDWGKYRFDKEIISGKDDGLNSATVIKVSGEEFEDEWHNEVLNFIKVLKESGRVTDYNQIAFLFRSVKSERVVGLSKFLEDNGINVYSPRSDMFFKRSEIKLVLGALMLTFPQYVKKLNEDSFPFMNEKLSNYYIECIQDIFSNLKETNNKPLMQWIKHKALEHSNLIKNADYGLSGLMYQIFQFEPFKSFLDVDLSGGIVDTRPAYNLSILSNMIVRYEYLHRLDVLTSANIESQTEKFFNMYFRFLFDGGIGEFEDESEYAPSGCVSFLTIHQSKGMEFPIVFVGSLNSVPRADRDEILDLLSQKYYNRKPFEPEELIKYFDFWRVYYTAFSRAQDLLVLTCKEKSGRGMEPSKYFNDMYCKLPYYNDDEFDLTEFSFKKVKSVNIKHSYSFTSHILLFENCSLQYKFYKELGFKPVRVGATLFGSLVHQTIEDVHRAALRNEVHLITNDNIDIWFNNNYNSLVKKERAYLGEAQKNVALNQVKRYVKRQEGQWDRIQNAEVEVSLVKENYILEGTVDLIQGQGDTVEIIDFKSEKKPDIFKDREKIERYRKQLEVYSHIIEERTGKKVSKLHLYYTGELEGVPTISFPKQKDSIDNTIKDFDNIVCKIQNKDFSKKSQSEVICSNCDMRFYCK